MASVALGYAQAARAQANFPARALHLIVPTSAGGVHDVIGAHLGRPGASRRSARSWSRTAAAAAPRSRSTTSPNRRPTAITLLLGSTSTLVLREGGGNRAYDALKDIVAGLDLRHHLDLDRGQSGGAGEHVKELIDYVSANPGKLSYGSGGVGAITHITVEMFKQRAGGLDILHVPYRGMAPAMNDLLGGQIAVGFPNITAQVVELHRGGKIRILAVNAPARLEAAPDIPTASEAGLPDFVSQIFFGVFAPAGTPKPMLEKLNEATQKEWADKAISARS